MATINHVKTKKPSEEEVVKYYGAIPEDARIESVPSSFKTIGKFTMINSDELSKLIYAQFAGVFHDLKGVNIKYIDNRFVPEFYFEVNTETLPDNKIRNLINLTTPVRENKFNLYYRNAVVQNKLHGKVFTLNDETKLLLSDFMYGGRDANKPNNKKWNNFISEVRMPANHFDPFAKNVDRIFVCVTGFDPKRLLQFKFGRDMIVNTTKDPETGDDQNFHANALYEMYFVKMNLDGTFLVRIDQFDEVAMEQLATKVNPQLQNLSAIKFYNT